MPNFSRCTPAWQHQVDPTNQVRAHCALRYSRIWLTHQALGLLGFSSGLYFPPISITSYVTPSSLAAQPCTSPTFPSRSPSPKPPTQHYLLRYISFNPKLRHKNSKNSNKNSYKTTLNSNLHTFITYHITPLAPVHPFTTPPLLRAYATLKIKQT